eukprot:TRINITY_DN702_c0_g1_i1.p1 TRINITY_DN702_c0_g1~~TRINITY_DN702_c0_g1_i1.p1  ORF type:complete len:467 (-),score=53.39 TRINITY_DN702_c0_g1_i1:28-1380(-)
MEEAAAAGGGIGQVSGGGGTPVDMSAKQGEVDHTGPMHVLIIGGGLAGLALAQCLRKAGVSFHLYERDDGADFRAQGYRIRVSGDVAMSLKDLLEPAVFDRFEKTCAAWEAQGRSCNARSGKEEPSRIPRPETDRPPYPADRSVMRSILLSGIERWISFGKRLEHFTQSETGVTAYFADGTTASGTLLVGADGINSVVRRQYLPGHRTYDTGSCLIYGKTLITPQVEEQLAKAECARGMCLIKDTDVDPPVVVLLEAMRFPRPPTPTQPEDVAATGSSQQDLGSLPSDYIYWVLGANEKAFPMAKEEFVNLRRPEAAQLALRMTALWDERIRALFAHQDPAQTAALRIRCANPELAPWSPSRVTLIGDAIHVMPPTGGSGLNTALRDVHTLTKHLTSAATATTASSITESVRLYEQEMRAYASQFIAFSLQGGKHMLGMRDFQHMEVIAD